MFKCEGEASVIAKSALNLIFNRKEMLFYQSKKVKFLTIKELDWYGTVTTPA